MVTRKRVLIASGFAVVAGVVIFLIALSRMTPVPKAQAVERFHQERREIGHRPNQSPARATKASHTRTRADRDGEQRERRPAKAAKGGASRETSPAAQPDPTGETADQPPVAAPSESGWPTMPEVVRPAEGVYTYRTEGHEGFVGIFDRKFPPTSHRSVVHTGPASWSDHTIFSEERESWSVFSFDEGGGRRLVHSQRNRVAFPGYTQDQTITFDPPLVSSWVPWSVGRTWTGTFSGETYGSYEGETVKNEYVKVGDQNVMAWVDHLTAVLHGRVEGAVDVTRWLSPTHGVTLREEYRADAWLGPLHYVAEWSVTLRSMEPAY